MITCNKKKSKPKKFNLTPLNFNEKLLLVNWTLQGKTYSMNHYKMKISYAIVWKVGPARKWKLFKDKSFMDQM